jgi:hypothetical protein
MNRRRTCCAESHCYERQDALDDAQHKHGIDGHISDSKHGGQRGEVLVIAVVTIDVEGRLVDLAANCKGSEDVESI